MENFWLFLLLPVASIFNSFIVFPLLRYIFSLIHSSYCLSPSLSYCTLVFHTLSQICSRPSFVCIAIRSTGVVHQYILILVCLQVLSLYFLFDLSLWLCFSNFENLYSVLYFSWKYQDSQPYVSTGLCKYCELNFVCNLFLVDKIVFYRVKHYYHFVIFHLCPYIVFHLVINNSFSGEKHNSIVSFLPLCVYVLPATRFRYQAILKQTTLTWQNMTHNGKQHIIELRFH